MKTAIVLLLLCASPAAATPITAPSWDGNPPGNLSQLMGVDDFQIGVPAFAAGIWTLTIDGGYSAWWSQNQIGFRPASGGWEYLLWPGLIQSTIFTTPDPWVLTAKTPSFASALSTGPQWAFWTDASNVLHWGLEDILLPGAEPDYQDAYGTLVRRPDVVIDQHKVPAPVPEPGTWTLVGLGLAALLRRRMMK